MTRRAKEYRAEISQKIRASPEYAEHYIRAAIMNHDESLETALANAIDQFGHAEFAKRLGKFAPNITRTVNKLKEGGDFKMSTLKAFLAAFGITKKVTDSLIYDDATHQPETSNNDKIFNSGVTDSSVDEDANWEIWDTFRHEERGFGT